MHGTDASSKGLDVYDSAGKPGSDQWIDAFKAWTLRL